METKANIQTLFSNCLNHRYIYSSIVLLCVGFFISGCGALNVEDRQWQRTEIQKVNFTLNAFGWNADLVKGKREVEFYRASLEYQQCKRYAVNNLIVCGNRFSNTKENQFTNIEKWINEQKIPVFMVAYVHGWHHNAMSDDANFLKFNNLLTRVKDQLIRRREEEMIVLGVYVGWQGESNGSLTSIGDRACAAEVIALGQKPRCRDSSNIADINSTAPLPTSLEGDLISLVATVNKTNGKSLFIGHSLGGRVLSKMLASKLKHNAQPLGSGSYVLTVNAATGTDDFAALYKEKEDKVVKKNAMPYWINVTSKDDLATKYAYTVGTLLFGIPNDGYKTIGHDGDRITHTLHLTKSGHADYHCYFPSSEKNYYLPQDIQCFANKDKTDIFTPAEEKLFKWQKPTTWFENRKDGIYLDIVYPESTSIGKHVPSRYQFSATPNKSNDCAKKTGIQRCLDVQVYSIELKQKSPTQNNTPSLDRMWNIQTDDQILDTKTTVDIELAGKHNGYISTNLINLAVEWVLSIPEKIPSPNH